MLKNKLFLIILIFIIVAIVILFARQSLTENHPKANINNSDQNNASNTQTPNVSEKDKPRIISTKPDPLEENVIGFRLKV